MTLLSGISWPSLSQRILLLPCYPPLLLGRNLPLEQRRLPNSWWWAHFSHKLMISACSVEYTMHICSGLMAGQCTAHHPILKVWRDQLLNWSGEAKLFPRGKEAEREWASSLTLFSYSGSEFPLEKTGIESGVMSGLSPYCISERRNPSFLIRRFFSYHGWLIKVWYVGIWVSIDWHRPSLINSSKKASSKSVCA